MPFERQFANPEPKRNPRRHRLGAACVELAVLSPILLLLFLGIVEVGQYVNVGQSVSNASREGARIAARQTTTNVTQIQAAVADYLTSTHPGLSSSAVQVTVANGSSVPSGGGGGGGGGATALSGGDIATVATGSPVTVQVVVPFDSVRWLNGLSLLSGRSLSRSTVTRRE